VLIAKAGSVELDFESGGKYTAPLEIRIKPWPSTKLENLIWAPLDGVKINKQTPEEEPIRAWPGLVVDPQNKEMKVVFPESLVKVINGGGKLKFNENLVS